ncbi:YkvA family protein [Lapillicoccus jejuensis]|uniref:Uncharacterized membrane protein YkvA (DUF1232 family) n=1 Tax=Lapillicoccus jejuensis TaxID=402171 RepID=A0A542E6T2_9MICO|nr:YkvA family protein [Lapillicoccus jejuensis]TQJ11045.1 uncharacterized membrane protein YkvA (DUF1232 family) [Lapillicoccus jejuensis]
MPRTSARPGRTGLLRQLAGAVRVTLRPGGPGLADRGRAVPRLVRAVLSGRYRAVTPGHLGLLLLAVAYVASPVDLLPEGLLPLVGLADDAVVVAWLAAALVHDTEAFLQWERTAGPGRSAGRTSSGATDGGSTTGPRDRWGRPQDAPDGAHRHDRRAGWGTSTVEGHVVR